MIPKPKVLLRLALKHPTETFLANCVLSMNRSIYYKNFFALMNQQQMRQLQ
jgi:hypothetical protein